MLFNTLSFGIFLIVTYLLYWIIFNRNIKIRNIFILVASYFFYGWWDWRLLGLIALISATDYIFGALIFKEKESLGKRRWLLAVSLIINLGILGFFKYYNFFVDSFMDILKLFGGSGAGAHTLNIILPVGISFYTFQGLSYVLDIYYRKFEPTKDVVAFFAFISFFPQLVAGPIEKAKDLLPQFFTPKKFDYDEARKGLFQIAVGLFKKMVIADRLAIYVDSVYGNVEAANGISVLTATVFFAFQLYLDFSAYSQIAIGTARLFGFKLHVNFNKPYLSINFKDFWSRWHITLMNWFRDYLYIPLGGNRKGKARMLLNIFIVFAVSGLWHGASWNFVIWGCINGLFLIIFDKILHLQPRSGIAKILSCLLVFCAWTFSLIFFRANTFADAIAVFSRVGFGNASDLLLHGMNSAEFSLSIALIVLLMIAEILQKGREERAEELFFEGSKVLRWSCYIILVLSVIYLGIYGAGSDNAFIYFQF